MKHELRQGWVCAETNTYFEQADNPYHPSRHFKVSELPQDGSCMLSDGTVLTAEDFWDKLCVIEGQHPRQSKRDDIRMTLTVKPPEPKWCEHITPNDNGTVWLLEANSDHPAYVSDTWKECPICLVKRPEVK